MKRGSKGIRFSWKICRNELSWLEVSLEPYTIELRTSFGTSHSQTVERTNALFTVGIQTNGSRSRGWAEVGLPPKKPGIYDADFSDTVQTTKAYLHLLGRAIAVETCSNASLLCMIDDEIKETVIFGNETPCFKISDPFEGIKSSYFTTLRESCANDSSLRLLLSVLDQCKSSHSAARPACAGIEIALLDSWCRSSGVPLNQAICPEVKKPCRVSFYTVAMNKNMEEVIASALFGIRFTPFLKLKLGPSVEQNLHFLEVLFDALKSSGQSVEEKTWSIDANACLSPEKTLALLRQMPASIRNCIYMLEQPFPHDVVRNNLHNCRTVPDGGTSPSWMNVKSAWEQEGILVFADESVRDAEDIVPLRSICSGVNLKLEKAGGMRELARAATAAHDLGLRVWIGCMVGSSLNSTAAAHALALCDTACDLDGSLLIHPDSERFVGGFRWSKRSQATILDVIPSLLVGPYGYVILSDAPGTGLIRIETS